MRAGSLYKCISACIPSRESPIVGHVGYSYFFAVKRTLVNMLIYKSLHLRIISNNKYSEMVLCSEAINLF